MDESKFELFGQKQRIRVWKKHEELQDYIQSYSEDDKVWWRKSYGLGMI